MTIERGYAKGRFGQLHYRIAPGAPGTEDTPPLLCLHQTPSHGGEWEPVMEPLSRHRTVVALDTPGYGMSDSPPEPASIEDFAAIAAQFMTDLAEQGLVPGGSFDVIGFHTGSVIATQLARSLPGRVRRIVVFGLAAYSAEVRAAKLANLRNAFPVPGVDLTHIEKLWAIIGTLSDPRISYEERHVNMAECLRLGERMPWGYVSVYTYDFLGAMREVTQPVLIMNPDDDLRAVTNETAHNFPNATMVVLDGVKHGVLKLDRERVLTAIEGFLR